MIGGSDSSTCVGVLRRAFGLVLGSAGLLASVAGVAAQHDDHLVEAPFTVQPTTEYMPEALGPYTRPITTTSPWAQAYFDQGMQFLYAFTKQAAVASFEEAQRQDPTCAMCFWGEALARGPFLNGGMSTANAGPAYEAAMEAVRLSEAGRASAVEKALVDAMSLRYSEVHDPDTRAQLDSTYSRAMADVYRAFPLDLDVGTVYAESIMLLDPVRANYRMANPFVQSFHRVLEDVLALDISHPGACHLYVHATEATEEPGRAEACADLLGASIPGASHINHMPSHTYNRIGRWDSAVRANVQAWQSDRLAQTGEAVSYSASHNLHMLFFAASMAGQSAVGIEAARAYVEEVPNGEFYLALVLFRFGRFDEVLALENRPEQPIQSGLWEFAHGYALLRTGDVAGASLSLEAVDELARTTPANVQMRGHNAASLLGITGNILRGEIRREEGRMDEALAAFERAVELFDQLRYDEPEPLNFNPRHWLGALLLEQDRPVEAEAVYRRSLEQHPHNGWSIYGLELALRAQGRMAEAVEARAYYREAWDRADILIRSSRY